MRLFFCCIALITLGCKPAIQAVQDHRAFVLECEPREVSLGVIEPNKTVETVIKLTNKSSTEIVVKGVRKSCGCTNASLEKQRLTAAESATLRITITPDSTSLMSLIGLDYTVDESEVLHLQIPVYWEIKRPLEFENHELILGKFARGEERSVSFKFRTDLGFADEELDRLIAVTDHSVQVAIDKVEKTVSIKADTSSAGRFQASMRLQTTSNTNQIEGHLIEIPILWEVVDLDELRIIGTDPSAVGTNWHTRFLVLSNEEFEPSDLVVRLTPSDHTNMNLTARSEKSCWVELSGTLSATPVEYHLTFTCESGSGSKMAERVLRIEGLR